MSRAHAVKVWGLTPELAILLGVAGRRRCSASSSALLAIRRQGIYFAMITLALAQMFFFFCLQAPFTRGEDGIQGVPRGTLFGLIDLDDDSTCTTSCSAIFLVGFLLIWRIVHSPFGKILKAIRENEPRAISLGYDTDRYKLAAFVMSARSPGLAGGTKAHRVPVRHPDRRALVDVGRGHPDDAVGGIGTVFGPVVGAARHRRPAELPRPARLPG